MPESEKIWKIRKSVAEAFRHESLVQSNEDAVVPLDQLPSAMKAMVGICEKHDAVARVVSHAGDGNIHLCIMPGTISAEQWDEKLAEIQDEIYAVIYPLGGRLSGEHGIGYKKKHLLEKYTNQVELSMMSAIKKALDPNLILNPGKLFEIQ
ncbi:MAG: putative FAD-linked oxidoreductase, partial [Firmicutes bacterium]|nr:putative FAD-linked oxidoreductase [Bacillota bacterium]